MQLASNLGVSPEFLGIEYCNYDGKEYAILIMQKYGSGNLTDLLRHDYYEENKHVINRQLKQILDTLYDNNVDQNDLHSDNFLYRMNENGDIEFKIIDFDKANLLGSDQRKYIIENLNKFEEVVNGKKVIKWGNPINVE
jgi:serine/threonine protein kinase